MNQAIENLKSQTLKHSSFLLLTSTSQKYKQNHMLMIGDAPGDLQAACANYALFYPINPGQEEESWKLLHQEALSKFFNGQYAG